MNRYTRSVVSLCLPVLGLISLLSAPAHAQNLITNPGFETGDFTGWNTQAASSNSNFGVFFGNGHSSLFGVGFTGLGPDYDIISQDIATTPGANYVLSFWVNYPDGGVSSSLPIGFAGGTNSFQALVDGNVVTDLSSPTGGYTMFTDVFTASSPTTTITFQAFNIPSGYLLDDVRVSAAAPEPGSLALLGLAVLPIMGRVIRRK